MGMSIDQAFGKANTSGGKMVYNLDLVAQERRTRNNVEASRDYIFGKTDVNPNQDLVDKIDNIQSEIENYIFHIAEEVKSDIKKQKINR